MMRAIAPLSPPDAQAFGPGPDSLGQMADAQSASQVRALAYASSAKAGANAAVDPKEIERLRKVSQDFESLFLSYMMKVGREASMKGDLMGHSQGEEIFTEMRNDELAKHMAAAGGIGLAKLLVEQLTRTLQQQANKNAESVES